MMLDVTHLFFLRKGIFSYFLSHHLFLTVYPLDYQTWFPPPFQKHSYNHCYVTQEDYPSSCFYFFYNEKKKKDLFKQLLKKSLQKHLITSVAIQTHCLQECALIFFIVLMCYCLKQIQKLEPKQVWIWIWAVFKTYLQTFRWEVCCRKERNY